MPVVLELLPEAAILLVELLGWGIALGLAYIWVHTFHHIFEGIAGKLRFHIPGPFGLGKTIDLGGWLKDLDRAALSLFTTWAKDQELAVGKWWYAIGWTVNEMVVAAQEAAQATLDLGHYVIHKAIPVAIDTATNPLKKKTNAAAAAAGAAGVLAALLKRATRAEHAAQQAATNAAAAAAHAAGHEAHAAKSVATTVERTVVHETKVITQVIDVGALPAQFGQTVKQIRRRLGKVEALLGATAMAIAMANVLGIPSWRCLTKGPVGRVSRALCGIPTNLLNDLLGLIADFFILENVCTILPWLEVAASDIGTPLVELLTEVGAGLCAGSQAPGALRGPTPSVPALIFGVSASGV